MARIAIGGLHHETNTFAPSRAGLDAFLQTDGWPGLLRGQAMFDGVAGINLAISGFVEAMVSSHSLVPLVWANAGPSGPVTRRAFETIAGWLIDDLKAALPVDAVFLDLHGAMVTEHLDDGEGDLLERVRACIGADIPIVVALDLHANVSDAMVSVADRLEAYRTYPHVDIADTGRRCARQLDVILNDGGRPARAHVKLPFLIPLPAQCTLSEPAAGIYQACRDASPEGQAIGASVALGFPNADTAATGPSIIAYAQTEHQARCLAERLATQILAAESAITEALYAPAEAVRLALAEGSGEAPWVLADTQDNPGGGGSSDTTGLLQALIDAKADDALLGLMVDPVLAEIAHTIGVGGQIEAPLGGRHGPSGVQPVAGPFRIEALGNGRFIAQSAMYAGARMELGPMALVRVVRAPGVQVVVASRRVQLADLAMLAHLGVDPRKLKILAVKSSVHFRAAFQELAERILVVKAPGHVLAEPADLPFCKLRPGVRIGPRSGEVTHRRKP